MSPHHRSRNILAAVMAVLFLPATVIAAGADTGDHTKYDRVVDITFPVGGDHHTPDTYHAKRGGSTRECSAQGVSGRVHQATDVMADKMQPVYAAMGGTVSWAPETEPSYGWMIRIDGDDGLEYSYVHLNNDTPGTDDGAGGIENAYAPGVRKGARVERGQHIGWVGDSGNAEGTGSHVHFEMEDPLLDDPRLECPYQSKRMNPYPSLMAALERGDVPPADPADAPATNRSIQPGAENWIFYDVPPDGTHAGAIELLVDEGITEGCAEENFFCPGDDVKRAQMASFISRAMDAPVSASADEVVAELVDVPDDGTHSKAIGTLVEHGIVTLCDPESSRFCPSEALTRADMAVWLANALDLSGGQRTFEDVPADAGYAPAVAAIADLGITTGCNADGTRFCPDDPVSRGQMATFLTKAFLDG